MMQSIGYIVAIKFVRNIKNLKLKKKNLTYKKVETEKKFWNSEDVKLEKKSKLLKFETENQ